MEIRLIKHEPIPKTGSYEVRYPDGRRLRPDLVDGETAEAEAKAFARAEQDKLEGTSR